MIVGPIPSPGTDTRRHGPHPLPSFCVLPHPLLPPPGSAGILPACGLKARTPGPLPQTGTAQAGQPQGVAPTRCIPSPLEGEG